MALDSAPADCVVSDVGSTKRVLADAGSDERFIGGHPLAGAETAGVEHAREDLFEGATWYLTPARGSTAGVLYERLHRLLTSFGARPTAIDAETHDRLMACVSHLPHVLANLLVAQASGLRRRRGLAAPARGRPELPRRDPRRRRQQRDLDRHLHLQPRRADRRHRRARRRACGDVRAALAARRRGGDHAPGTSAPAPTARRCSAPGSTGGPVHELRASVPNRPGVMAEIALALGGEGVNIVDMALSPSEDNRQGVVALWIGGDEHAERAQRADRRPGVPGGAGMRARAR